MAWWQKFLVIQDFPDQEELRLKVKRNDYQQKNIDGDPEKKDLVFLIRSRVSRIYYLRRFFDYPLALNVNFVKNLGVARLFKIGWSYLWSRLVPRRKERSLEDFLINRFGQGLYELFFKDYTHKVWGRPAQEIDAQWGRQRIKGLSIVKVIRHAIFKEKQTETSLIEKFYYPKYGPGQLWEEVAKQIVARGGTIMLNSEIVSVTSTPGSPGRIKNVVVRSTIDNSETTLEADYFISSMALKDLINCLTGTLPLAVRTVASQLPYRDFITVGLLLKKLKLQNKTQVKTANDLVPDNWIYIQENDVQLGRLQIFNNWSPYLLKDSSLVWLGLEYFCDQQDALWQMSDEALIKFATKEVEKLGLVDQKEVLDGVCYRMTKAYPAYFGSYDQIQVLRDYLNQVDNLYLIGRNGLHRYNNMDHSMLTAIKTVENISRGLTDKSGIWQINAEGAYHEAKRD